MSAYPLFEAHPGLARALPVAGLLAGPTPVEPLPEGPGVFLKRDDLSAADFGGNKVRKLDFVLAEAVLRGTRDVLTFGYAGSNFVAATAWHGRKLGLSTLGYLLPQAGADYIADNLAVALAAGAELHVRESAGALVRAATLRTLARLARTRRLPRWIPPGGSSPRGVVGFINAAFELGRQVEQGLLPEPDRLYVAFSSMGTVAGLALGCARLGLKTRIEAIQVVGPEIASERALRSLAARTLRWLRRLDPGFAVEGDALERVRIRGEFFGGGYARPGRGTVPAMQRFAAVTGARADSCYSGKALAALYADLETGALRGEAVLYWHTLSARRLPPGVTVPAAPAVPEALRGYFSGAGPEA